MRNYAPITVSNYTFEDTVEGGYLYIDKTDYFHRLLTVPKGIFFLSRPRRFGKSLGVSILKNIFLGRRELFKGLKIYDLPYDWKVYPVVNLNISKVDCSSEALLNEGLCMLLHSAAEENGVTLPPLTHPGYLFKTLIDTLAIGGQKVVVLIDEYDKPMVENLYSDHLPEIRTILENFYIHIKASDDKLRFVFMTGVTKFSKVSVFSKLNNMVDLTMDAQMATCYGYTQEELDHYFGDQINELADKHGIPREAYREQIRIWYNGFRFHKDAQTVYNPVSIGSFINSGGEFVNYWFATGSPSFLMKTIKRNEFDFVGGFDEPMMGILLDIFDINNKNLMPILLQTGYLTIDRVEWIVNGYAYYLRFPNFEIEHAFQTYLLEALEERSGLNVAADLFKMNRALRDADLETLEELMRAHLAAIPYLTHSSYEDLYKNIFFSLFRLLGAEVHNEVRIIKGAIDCIIVNKQNIYIFEYKIDQPAAVAIEQIKTRGYADAYRTAGKPIHLIGICLDGQTRRISDWAVESSY